MSEEVNKINTTDAGDESKAAELGIDIPTMRENAKAFQRGLHEVIADYVKDFNVKHCRKDGSGDDLDAYGVYAMFTYSARAKRGDDEIAAAVVTGTSQNYSPGGAEGFEVLVGGLQESFREHRSEIAARALENLLRGVAERRAEDTIPADATIN